MQLHSAPEIFIVVRERGSKSRRANLIRHCVSSSDSWTNGCLSYVVVFFNNDLSILFTITRLLLDDPDRTYTTVLI